MKGKPIGTTCQYCGEIKYMEHRCKGMSIATRSTAERAAYSAQKIIGQMLGHRTSDHRLEDMAEVWWSSFGEQFNG